EEPGDRIRYHVENDRGSYRRGKERFERSPILQKQTEPGDKGEADVMRSYKWTEKRRTILHVPNDVGNEKSDHRNRKFVSRRKISRRAKCDRGERGKVRQPGRTGNNGEAHYDSITDRSQNNEKSGNHRPDLNLPEG